MIRGQESSSVNLEAIPQPHRAPTPGSFSSTPRHGMVSLADTLHTSWESGLGLPQWPIST